MAHLGKFEGYFQGLARWHISKLAYKFMRLEIMRPIDIFKNGPNPLGTSGVAYNFKKHINLFQFGLVRIL
jgi:hypothetical protein